MRRDEFKAWLSKQTSKESGNKLKSPGTLVTDALKVERSLGDLDSAFDRDGLQTFLTLLTYGAADVRAKKA